MTDLRTAAQQALDALNLVSDEGESKFPATIQGVISDLEAALAQQAEPVQEPVAWLWKIKAVDTGPHTQQLYFFSGDGKPWSDGWTWTPLYTAPPQRKPLTEEEIVRLMVGEDRVQLLYAKPGDPYFSEFAEGAIRELVDSGRAIERAHGIGEEK